MRMEYVRKTLSQISEYPDPEDLYKNLMASVGWQYKTDMEYFKARDRALVALLYLGDFRISEVLNLTKDNFKTKGDHVLVTGVKVGKRKKGEILYREAKLPLRAKREPFTRLVLDYINLMKAEQRDGDRLFPFSLRAVEYKSGFYKLKSGEIKQRYRKTLQGTTRIWQIVNALLPEYTAHWLRAFGYNFDYDSMDHDILAVSDKTKADPRSIQPYLRRRYEKYPVR
jgi:hypothetical protein